MDGPRVVTPDICRQRHAPPIDAAVGALADAQYGVVARRQLVALGLSARVIEHRVGVGRLHRLHRGVYAVGHRVLSREGRWMAAVLAGGPEAVLSHRSAAALWGMRPTAAGRIDVIVPRALRQRPGLRFHRLRPATDEVTEEQGIPVTTPTRTLLDLAAVLGRDALQRAAEQAEVLRLPDARSLDDVVSRYPNRAGVRKLAAIAADARFGESIPRSELEERFLAFLDQAGLPRPRVNARLEVAGRVFEVDCVWPEARLVVELDGHATHGTRRAFERDRERDRLLQAAAWRVARVTWRQLHLQPAELRRDLARLLGLPG